MRVSKVKISGILGIEELEFEAGAFVAFVGENESGKTSALSAIQAVLGRDGDDATLLRRGSEKGEIVLVMDDGTEITKKVTPAGARTEYSGPAGKTSAPNTAIKALTDAMSVNPVSFIRSGETPADKRQRLAWLLECLPAVIDQGRLEEIAGPAAKVADPSWSAFDQLEAVHRTIFEDRTATNRAITEKNGSINQLEQTLPEDEEGMVSGDPDAVQAQLDAMDAANNAALQGVSETLAGYERQSSERAQAIRDGAETTRAAKREAIARLQAEIAELDQKQAADLAVETQWITDARAGAERKKAEIAAAHATNREPHVATLRAIRDGANAVAKAAQTRAHIKVFSDAIRDLEEDARRQTRQLEAIQAYKSELLENIPIDGLTVDDGEIFRNGVPFNRLNTALQVDMAVEIAKLRAKAAGIICVDGIENLDSTQYEAFRAKSVESGLQIFVTRVESGPLAVQITN